MIGMRHIGLFVSHGNFNDSNAAPSRARPSPAAMIAPWYFTAPCRHDVFFSYIAHRFRTDTQLKDIFCWLSKCKSDAIAKIGPRQFDSLRRWLVEYSLIDQFAKTYRIDSCCYCHLELAPSYPS
jgi:hypothetical protein